MSLASALGLGTKLGAILIGNIIAGSLYGITCLQTFIYFKKSFKDSRSFKLLILFLWAIDTLHLIFITHSLYYYMVTNYGNPLTLLFPVWSLLGQVFLTLVSDFIIRVIFFRRIWLLTGGNKLLAASIIGSCLFAVGTGMAYGIREFQLNSFAKMQSISFLMYTSFAGAVMVDLIIATSLCVTLSRNRTGFKKTDTLVNTLMIYAINTGAFTTICSLACFITYAVWPTEFIFIGIYFCLSKLYFNSLLATLNSRQQLQARMAGLSDIPVALSQGSKNNGHMEYSMVSVGSIRAAPQVLVSIDRRVDIDEGSSI